MKKAVLILVLIVIVCSLMVGCSKNNLDSTANTDRFYYIKDSSDGLSYNDIIVDKTTGVMYLFHGVGNNGGLTIMVDTEGKPLIYDGEY